MRKSLLLLPLLLAGCLGNSSVDNEVVGQVKRTIHKTPLLCPDRNVVDLSLGVMVGGSGSMSKEDMWLYVPIETDYAKLVNAQQSGAIVKIIYDDARFYWCAETHCKKC
jgi:hypothetical protein